MTKKRVEYNDDPQPGGHARQEVTDRFYAYWDCSKCGHQGILGNVKSCPNCGSDKTTETYRPPKAGEEKVPITAESAQKDGIDLVEHHSDENCRFCGATLKPGTQICPECHAPLNDPAYVHRICPACQRKTNELACPDCGQGTVPISEFQPSESVPQRRVSVESLTSQPDHSRLKVILGIGALIVLAVILTIALWPKKQSATVTQINWESFVRMEEYQYNPHGDWNLPSDADLNDSYDKIHHYVDVPIGNHQECHWEQVADGGHQECSTDTECHSETVYSGSHTECYGDGSCSTVSDYDYQTVCEPVTNCDWVTDYRNEQVCITVTDYRQDPVYQTWYEYHIWEWVGISPLTRAGTELPIYWADSTNIPKNQRAVSQDADCTITFMVEKKNIGQEVDCNQLPDAKYQVGAHWKVRLIGGRIVSKEYVK